VYLAIGEFGFILISTISFYKTGEHIVRKLRIKYLETVIRQHMAYFDFLSPGEVTTRATSDMELIQESITGKLSLTLIAVATFVGAFVIVFIQYWKLALILCSSIVVMALGGVIGVTQSVKLSKKALECYSYGAAVAEEAFSTMRNVAAHGIEDTFARKHFNHVSNAEAYAIKAGYTTAFMTCLMQGIPYLSYGLAFWQGSQFISTGEMKGSSVITATLAIVIGALAITRVTPNTQAFTSGIASASRIHKSIALRSSQDPLSTEGMTPQSVQGDIEFKDVGLMYPSRIDVKVFAGLDLAIRSGKTTAIVGPSGSGKTSICSLLERFYTPSRGKISK
jgi:ATP-binding cassette subfamily B (MDR/TAP) protein 1